MHGPRQDDAGGPLQTPVVEEVKPEKTERARDGGPQRREGEAQTKWAGGRKAVGHGCATLRPPASGIWGTAFSGGGGGARGGEERDGGASAHGALPASRPPACCRGALSPTLPPIHRPAAPRRAPSRRSAENEQVDRDLH